MIRVFAEDVLLKNYANTDRKDNVPGFWFASSSPRKSVERNEKKKIYFTRKIGEMRRVI